MIVRKIRPEELKRTKELFAAAFHTVYENEKAPLAVYEDVCKNPKTREDVCPLDKYAALEDDDQTMMSCLSVIRYPMHFDGHTVVMAGIGGVSTLPQYRRRGGIRACFHKMMPELYQEDVVFSCLYPFSTEYYRKFGYEMSPQVSIYEWKLSFLPTGNARGHCVLVDASNRMDLLADVRRIDKVWQKRYNLMVCGEEWEYRFITEANPYQTCSYTYLYYKEDGTPAAYLTFHSEDTPGGKVIAATRLLFTDVCGLLGILALMRGFASDYTAVRFSLPEECEIEPLIRELSLNACTRTRGNMGMMRVIHVQKALELARYRGSGELTLRILDEQIQENNGVFSVRFEHNRAVCVKRLPAEEKAQLSMTIQDFSRFIIGAFETETMSFCRQLVWEGKGAPDTASFEKLGRVFYKKPCCLMENF